MARVCTAVCIENVGEIEVTPEPELPPLPSYNDTIAKQSRKKRGVTFAELQPCDLLKPEKIKVILPPKYEEVMDPDRAHPHKWLLVNVSKMILFTILVVAIIFLLFIFVSSVKK